IRDLERTPEIGTDGNSVSLHRPGCIELSRTGVSIEAIKEVVERPRDIEVAVACAAAEIESAKVVRLEAQLLGRGMSAHVVAPGVCQVQTASLVRIGGRRNERIGTRGPG